MNTLKILTKARALISDPARWTQRSAAKDVSGNDVLANSPKAVCWCSAGALLKASRRSSIGFVPMGTLSQEMEFSVSYFNDSHTHAEVLAAFDKAIERINKGSIVGTENHG